MNEEEWVELETHALEAYTTFKQQPNHQNAYRLFLCCSVNSAFANLLYRSYYVARAKYRIDSFSALHLSLLKHLAGPHPASEEIINGLIAKNYHLKEFFDLNDE